jgi:DDE family transposase
MKFSKKLEKGREPRRSRNFMPSGGESMISQGVRRTGLRSTRYIGRARTHLQYIASAAAINLAGLFDWLSEEGPGDSWVSNKELDSSLHNINHA